MDSIAKGSSINVTCLVAIIAAQNHGRTCIQMSSKKLRDSLMLHLLLGRQARVVRKAFYPKPRRVKRHKQATVLHNAIPQPRLFGVMNPGPWSDLKVVPINEQRMSSNQGTDSEVRRSPTTICPMLHLHGG